MNDIGHEYTRTHWTHTVHQMAITSLPQPHPPRKKRKSLCHLLTVEKQQSEHTDQAFSATMINLDEFD